MIKTVADFAVAAVNARLQRMRRFEHADHAHCELSVSQARAARPVCRRTRSGRQMFLQAGLLSLPAAARCHKHCGESSGLIPCRQRLQRSVKAAAEDQLQQVAVHVRHKFTHTSSVCLAAQQQRSYRCRLRGDPQILLSSRRVCDVPQQYSVTVLENQQSHTMY